MFSTYDFEDDCYIQSLMNYDSESELIEDTFDWLTEGNSKEERRAWIESAGGKAKACRLMNVKITSHAAQILMPGNIMLETETIEVPKMVPPKETKQEYVIRDGNFYRARPVEHLGNHYRPCSGSPENADLWSVYAAGPAPESDEGGGDIRFILPTSRESAWNRMPSSLQN